MPTHSSTHLHIREIAGVSPCNARKSPLSPEARADLKASIAEKGVLQPIMVRREGDRVMALDGGSRWSVLRELVAEIDPADAPRIASVGAVPVVWFMGEDADASEASLISFVQRSDLHPVDEFERFAELQDRHGFDAQRIAKETGKGLRFVQERLRLARLAPVVRDAWRNGEIEADVARAFSVSENEAAQTALFADLQKQDALDFPYRIKNTLRSDHLRLDSREIKFVGLDAYRAAGGRLDEQMFEEESYALDAVIAHRLVAEKLDEIGARICNEEGWGIVLLGDDPEFNRDDAADFAAEAARFEELHQKSVYQRTAEEKAELDAISVRAILRAVPAALRASRAIYVKLGWDGAKSTAISSARPEPPPPRTRTTPTPPPANGARARRAPRTRPPPRTSPANPSARPRARCWTRPSTPPCNTASNPGRNWR